MILLCGARWRSEGGVGVYTDWDASGSIPVPTSSFRCRPKADHSVLPARFQVHVHVRLELRRGLEDRALLPQLGGDVEEAADPVFGLDLALERHPEAVVGRRLGEPGQRLAVAER